jgi:hypothetical protein
MSAPTTTVHAATRIELALPGSISAICGAYVLDHAQASSRLALVTCPDCQRTLGMANHA